ncbi:MAG: ParB/RepB/Spo0J family partition protein [Micrococcales bacterium]|nr:ParB/RepB/Spo0J family partition protein [Micrococcales bacterium]
MSEKRRGLGRGLGALIPNGPATTDRPSDIFFKDGRYAAPADGDGAPGGAAAAYARAQHHDDAAQPGDATDPAAEHTVDETPAPVESDGGPTQQAAPADDGLEPVPGASFAHVPLQAIRPNPRQPRTVFDEDELAELVHSIKEIGVLQPVVVRPLVEPEDGVAYELIMGERRWRASQEAGAKAIPAIIKETQDDALLRDALLENLHRSQLNPLEEAAAYQQLLEDFGCTQEELAQRIGRSRPQVSNTLRLLKLPPLVARRVAAGVLSAGHARALLTLSDGGAMERLAQRVVAEGLSVRSVEEIVAMGVDPEPSAKARRAGGQRGPQLEDLAAELSDRLDTRVKIQVGQRKGRMTVEFASVDDLRRILETLGVSTEH